jgi:tripeptidyl-peptidase-1
LNTRKTPARDIEKRTFGWGKGHGILPPLLKALPMTIESILAAPLLALCDVAITPPCIEAMYNFTKATSAVKGNELGIFEDLGDVYAQEDLSLFFLFLQQRIPLNTHPELRAIDGAVAPASLANAGAESDLDFEISYPIIWPQNSVLFQTDDPVYEANYTYDGFLNNFFDAIDGSYCSYDGGNSPLDPPYPNPSNEPGAYKGQLQCGVWKPTNVISISYGGQESDLPASYQERQCNEILKLGMMGITTVVASGDSGVSGPPVTGDNGCLGPDMAIFNPDFPASCPYILTVGSTVLTGSAKADDERATTRFPSGGGFSNIYPIPSYQADAVNAYVNSADGQKYQSYDTTGGVVPASTSGRYNRAGRGYPDVSAVGDNIVVFNKGAPTLIGGTSASCPVWAALLTRINDERLKAGKSTVGFVNPTLYKNPSALHDIVVGSNPGCDSDGFSAAQGWDPVTGLGTPNYPALLKVFMSQ